MNYPFNYLLLVALIGMPVLLWLLRKIALKTGLVDIPNARKIHADAIPLVGGLALFVMSAVLLLLSGEITPFEFYLMLASGLVMVVGLLDDLFQLTALWRFAVQIVASLVMIHFAHVQIDTFGYLLFPGWNIELGLVAIPVTVFGVVGIINALNMADGIDGLAAMTFFVPILVLSVLTNDSHMQSWLLLILVCLLVFVIFNKSKRFKVFLGDNGSMFLGFILAWLLVDSSQGEKSFIKPVTALYLVALPVFDTIFVMLRRMLAGGSPFKPDKSHLHHLFLACEFTQTKALVAMIISQSMLIGLGLILLTMGVGEYIQFYLFVLLSIVYYLLMQKMWQLKKLTS
jgi:UDP-GlcNAc:undecaprenyl-phosphate GlcNAc-1-phosphate transferase